MIKYIYIQNMYMDTNNLVPLLLYYQILEYLYIYIIHSIALYHFIPRLSLDYYFHKSLNPTEAIIGAILFVIGITTASYYYHKIYKYAKEKYFMKDK